MTSWKTAICSLSERRPQRQAGLTASGFFDTGDLRHELKFGFGYKKLSIDSMTSFPGDGLFGVECSEPSRPPALITRPANVRSRGELLQHLPGRHDPGRQPHRECRGSFRLPAGEESPFGRSGQSRLSRTPSGRPIRGRLGVPDHLAPGPAPRGSNVRPWKRPKTLLRASYSRFANRLNSEIRSINAFPGPAYFAYDWNDANENQRVEPDEVDLANILAPSTSIRPIRALPFPSTKLQGTSSLLTTDEFIVGAERQILADLSASFAYTYRSVRNLEFEPLIGTSRSSYEYIGNATRDRRGRRDRLRPEFQRAVLRPDGVPLHPRLRRSRLENRPDFTQTYSGVELQLVKSLSHGWMLRASFAYNDWQQHVGPGAIVDPNNMAGGSNASGPVVEGNINSKWQFNVSGMVQLPLGIETSANLLRPPGLSDRVLCLSRSRTTRTIRYPISRSGRSAPIGFPASSCSISMSRRLFRIGSTVTISAVLDCFNVANSHTRAPARRVRRSLRCEKRPGLRLLRTTKACQPTARRAPQQPGLPWWRADRVLADSIERAIHHEELQRPRLRLNTSRTFHPE